MPLYKFGNRDPHELNKDDIMIKLPCDSKLSHICMKDDEEVDIAALRAEIENTPQESRKDEINKEDKSTLTPLFYAVVKGSVEAAEIFIENGAEVNKTNKRGYTPLFYAAGELDNVEMTNMLLKRGADPNFSGNPENFSPMYLAAGYGNLDILKSLFKSGADPGVANIDGEVPLHVAKQDRCKKLLFDISRTINLKKEKEGLVCDNCKLPVERLKRCANCRAKFYCTKNCQEIDWRNGHNRKCKGFVVACENLGLGEDYRYCSTISNQLRAKEFTMSYSGLTDLKVRNSKTFKKRVSHHIGSLFVVKVQIPLTPALQQMMMVYCEDQCCLFWIMEDNMSYCDLYDFISNKGVSGKKGYFWAEILDFAAQKIKIYHAKMAPIQPW